MNPAQSQVEQTGREETDNQLDVRQICDARFSRARSASGVAVASRGTDGVASANLHHTEASQN